MVNIVFSIKKIKKISILKIILATELLAQDASTVYKLVQFVFLM